MQNALTQANINMYAVLRNLEDLCRLCPEAQELIQGADLSIQMNVKNGPCGNLSFKNGNCTFKRGKHKSSITLYFRSPQHFNGMVAGESKPIPLKGFTKLKFLTTNFIKLTEILEYYLRPTDELLQNETYLNINTELSAYTAFFALSEVGNTDPMGILSAKRIPDGKIAVQVLNGGPSVNVHSKEGILSTSKGLPNEYRSEMSFVDIPTANAVLTGRSDSYTCLASGKLIMKGFIPMLDNLNKLLLIVQSYLN